MNAHPLRPSPQVVDHPPRRRQLPRHGARRPPAALFVHGVGTNAYLWRNVLDELAGDRRCVALDLPLHGRARRRPTATTRSRPGRHRRRVLRRARPRPRSTSSPTTPAARSRRSSRPVTPSGSAASRSPTATPTTTCRPRRSSRPSTWPGRARSHPARPACSPTWRWPATSCSRWATSTPTSSTSTSCAAFLEPVIGTPERRARSSGCWRGSNPTTCSRSSRCSRELTVPTLVVWGTGDEFFELRWAYWLRDTIPGVDRGRRDRRGQAVLPRRARRRARAAPAPALGGRAGRQPRVASPHERPIGRRGVGRLVARGCRLPDLPALVRRHERRRRRRPARRHRPSRPPRVARGRRHLAEPGDGVARRRLGLRRRRLPRVAPGARDDRPTSTTLVAEAARRGIRVLLDLVPEPHEHRAPVVRRRAARRATARTATGTCGPTRSPTARRRTTG